MDIEIFYNRIITKMPSDLTDLEKARYIYIELGKLFTFDEKYLLAPVKVQNKLYKMAIEDKVDFKDLATKKHSKALCVSIANAYALLLNSVGIHARAYQEDLRDPHLNTLLTLDGCSYFADLQRDLLYIQSKRKTHFFGNTFAYNKEFISDDQLKVVDSKIGYDYEGDIYLEDNLLSLIDKTKCEKSLSEKVKNILKAAMNAPGASEMDYSERSNLCTAFLRKVLDAEDFMKVKKHDMQVSNEQNSENFLLCYFVKPHSSKNKEDEYSVLVFSEKHKQFISFPYKKFNELVDRSNYNFSEFDDISKLNFESHCNFEEDENKNLNNNIIGGRDESR